MTGWTEKKKKMEVEAGRGVPKIYISGQDRMHDSQIEHATSEGSEGVEHLTTDHDVRFPKY